MWKIVVWFVVGSTQKRVQSPFFIKMYLTVFVLVKKQVSYTTNNLLRRQKSEDSFALRIFAFNFFVM